MEKDLIGESTTRKRRLMLLDDAAGSSINFKNASAEFGSAGRASARDMSDGNNTRQIIHYSLGSVGTPVKNLSSKKNLPRANSEVEMGEGDINDDEEDPDD